MVVLIDHKSRSVGSITVPALVPIKIAVLGDEIPFMQRAQRNRANRLSLGVHFEKQVIGV